MSFREWCVNPPLSEVWHCPSCTLQNSLCVKICDACQQPRPENPIKHETPKIPKQQAASSNKNFKQKYTISELKSFATAVNNDIAKETQNLDSFSEAPPWTCPACTFHNISCLKACEVCETPRPMDSQYSITPTEASELQPNPTEVEVNVGLAKMTLVNNKAEQLSSCEVWYCSYCTLQNSSSVTNCGVCEKPRLVSQADHNTQPEALELWYCLSCAAQNSSSVKSCGVCEKKLKERQDRSEEGRKDEDRPKPKEEVSPFSSKIKLCKYQHRCTNYFCNFLHPTNRQVLCQYGEQCIEGWERGRPCPYLHPRYCNIKSCSRPCSFRHEVSIQLPNEDVTGLVKKAKEEIMRTVGVGLFVNMRMKKVFVAGTQEKVHAAEMVIASTIICIGNAQNSNLCDSQNQTSPRIRQGVGDETCKKFKQQLYQFLEGSENQRALFSEAAAHIKFNKKIAGMSFGEWLVCLNDPNIYTHKNVAPGKEMVGLVPAFGSLQQADEQASNFGDEVCQLRLLIREKGWDDSKCKTLQHLQELVRFESAAELSGRVATGSKDKQIAIRATSLVPRTKTKSAGIGLLASHIPGMSSPSRPSLKTTASPVRAKGAVIEQHAKGAAIEEYALPEVPAIDEDRWAAMGGKMKLAVMVLGESGAGKSTVINTLVNYFKKGNFQKPFVAIPTQYHRSTEGFAHSESNLHNQRNSLTQTCTTYTFRDGPRQFDIIDTPGLGDTRGHQQDEINLDLILKAAEQAQLLSAIIFVVNGAVPRYNKHIEAVTTKLKSYLPDVFEKHLLVVFTHCQVAFKCLYDKTKLPFAPINESNIFYMENSAFSVDPAIFALALPRDLDYLTFDWASSMREFQRLVIRVTELGDTLTNVLIEFRASRDQLKAILCDVKLQMNELQAAQTQLDEIEEEMEKSKADARDFSNFTQSKAVKTKKLVDAPYHSTLCSTCNEVCHDHCGLDEISEMGDNRFIKCKAFKRKDNCRKCTNQCSFQVHFHGRKTMIEELSTVEEILADIKMKYDEAMGKYATANLQINDIASARQAVEDGIQNLVADLEGACKTIKKHCTAFNLAQEFATTISQIETEKRLMNNLAAIDTADRFIATIKAIVDALSRAPGGGHGRIRKR